MEDVVYWVDKYVDTFDEGFPFYHLPSMSDKELVEFIKECLRKGKPADPELTYDEDGNLVPT